MAEKLNIDGRQLEKITRGIVDFMKGTGEETYFPIVVKGQEISFLNAKEVAHLEEIAEIITHAKQGMLVILIASVVLITALALKGTARNIAIGVLEGFGLLVLGVTVVGLSALFNLSGWIDAFHHLFFTGDSWVLNPVTDRLIYLCPAELFSTALLMMGVFGAGYFIVVLGLCMLVLRKTK